MNSTFVSRATRALRLGLVLGLTASPLRAFDEFSVGARPAAHTVADALASIERAENAHQNAIDALRRSCGLQVDGGAK
jgi:hypothetical protein